MKFGKQIQEIASEWAQPFYLNYKNLKKSIPLGEIVFFYKLERELEKVNSFYLSQEQLLKQRVELLMKNKSLGSLRTLQQDLFKLQRFVRINQLGFIKILKKWDKQTKTAKKEIYLKGQVNVQPCFNQNYLSELADLIISEISNLEGVDMEPVESDLALFLRNSDAESVSKCVQSTPAGAASRLFYMYLTTTSIECLKVLLDYNVCNYVDDVDGKTALHKACISGRMDLVRLLQDRNADISISDVYGKYPLHYVAMHGHSEILKLLLKNDAETDPVDNDECTPLVLATLDGHCESVKILVEFGAKVDPVSDNARVPLCLACDYGYTEIARLFLEKGAKLVATTEGMYPLHLASRNGHDAIVSMLIARKADIEQKDTFYGWSPIFFAAQDGHFKCVELLLNAGAAVNLADQEGWTPLTYAFYQGHMQVAELLQSHTVKLAALNLNASASSSNAGRRDDAINMTPITPSGLFAAIKSPAVTSAKEKIGLTELDDIPSLSLPPPMMPFRIYGHNYLDGKLQLTITFPQNASDAIVLYDAHQMDSLKLVVNSDPDLGMPYWRNLPFSSDSEPMTFTSILIN